MTAFYIILGALITTNTLLGFIIKKQDVLIKKLRIAKEVSRGQNE